MAKVTTADVTNEIESRIDALKDGVKHVFDVSSERAAGLKDSAKTGIDALGTQIKKHPIAALAIAFGIGYVAMRLIRR